MASSLKQSRTMAARPKVSRPPSLLPPSLLLPSLIPISLLLVMGLCLAVPACQAATCSDAPFTPSVGGPGCLLDPAPPPAPLLALARLLLHAPIAFSGKVLPALPATTAEPNISTLRIRVEHGLRGVRDGDVFVYRVWQPNHTVAIPGQRLILFLHQPNAAGLSSSSIAEIGPLLITGDGQVDVRQLLLLERQLTPTPITLRRIPDPLPETMNNCPLERLKAADPPARAPRAGIQLPCRRGFPAAPSVLAGESMPEMRLLALARQVMARSVPDDGIHAP